MRKYLLIYSFFVIAGILLCFFYFHISKQKVFSCDAKYNLTQYVNNDVLLSEGILSAELSGDVFLINFEGFITSNSKNYILSRNIDLKLKKYNNSNHLYYITDMKVIIHDHDNTPENIAQQSLFGSLGNDKIIYIDRVNDDTILFGNQMLSQYGCERK